MTTRKKRARSPRAAAIRPLCEVWERLRLGQDLTSADRGLLLELCTSTLSDIDVRERFFETREGAAADDYGFFFTIDVLQHGDPADKQVRGAAADRWNISDERARKLIAQWKAESGQFIESYEGTQKELQTLVRVQRELRSATRASS